MTAKIQPRIDLKNRTKLETVIPLSIPYIIFVDPSDKCNFQCKFCPTGNRHLMSNTWGRNYGNMKFDLFKKIIDDICKFEKPIKVLRLYKDGEPLMNPNFAKMVKYARKSHCSKRIDTTINGSLLTPRLISDILDAGIDRINISVEGINSKQYFDFSNYSINFNDFTNNIYKLFTDRKRYEVPCEIFIKINGDIISEEDQEKFYDIFGDMCDLINIEHTISCWPDYQFDVEINKKQGVYGQPLKKEVMVCPYPFYSFSINSNGSASLCFLDWARDLLIGDVNVESVKDIWTSKNLRKYQLMFLKKLRRGQMFCSDCGQMTHGMSDDIDQYANEILKRMEDI